MTTNLIFPGIILAIIIILALIMIPIAKKQAKINKRFKGKYPEGHFISKWMGVFMVIGIPLGVAMENIAIGVGMGLAIGVAVGIAKEQAAKRAGIIRPLTKAEKNIRKKLVWVAISLLIFGVLAALAFFLLAV